MNQNKLETLVKEQLKLELNIKEFTNSNQTSLSVFNKNMRKFYKEAPFFYGVSFGSYNYITCDKSIYKDISSFNKYVNSYRMFEAYNIDLINNILSKHNYKISFLGEYYLPKINYKRTIKSKYKIEILTNDQIKKLYIHKQFKNALYYDSNEYRKDIVAVVAYDQEKIIGVSGATLDSKYLCSVGIDVIKEYQNNSIGTVLVNVITNYLLDLGLIPYYGVSISNIKSKRLALKCGYYPFWIEMNSLKIDKIKTFIDEENIHFFKKN